MMADLKLTRKREVSHNRQNTTHFNNVALEMPKIPMTTVKQPPTPTRTESRPDLGIFQFFKDLTSGRMNIDGNENIPFSLFISSQRRRKILQSMWANDDKVKKDGEKILGNYKKQLAEKLAREQAEKDTISMSRPTTGSRHSKRSKMGATTSSMASSRKEKDTQAQ